MGGASPLPPTPAPDRRGRGAPSDTSPTVAAAEPRLERPGAGALGGGPVLAVVSDLFFVSRIRETGRLTGVAVEFARTPDEVQAALDRQPRFVLVDLTAGYDYDRLLLAAEGARVPVLGFTTHALARQTQPWHARCRRVVTKETLTQELPALLREGIGS